MNSSVSGRWLTAGTGTIWAPATEELEWHSRCFDQSNFLFSSPCFRGHLHSSFAQGNADTAGRASSASAQWNWISVYMHNTHCLSFPKQPGSGYKHWETLSDGDADKKVSEGCTGENQGKSSKWNIHWVKLGLDGVQLQIRTYFSAKIWSTEQMKTFLHSRFHSFCCDCKICSFRAESGQSTTV